MKIKIHRGTHEIDDPCEEIWTESTSIVGDFVQTQKMVLMK
ncbi:hypothetical protein ACFL0J_05050 [Candidatus Neomarinimicrobiota bacterium]